MQPPPPAQRRTLAGHLWVALKGVCMGAANVVPGVSGGTIALITGIYEELVNAIRAVTVAGPVHLARGRFREFWRDINGNFLLALLAGVGIGVGSLARLMLRWLSEHPVLVWAFFFGLIVGSAIYICGKIRQWTPAAVAALVSGGVAGYWLTVATPADTPTAAWFLFLAGFAAICTMILPGVSGSFLLVLMGKYEFILEAIQELKLGVLAVFGAGCVAGLLAFAHLLAWMLRRFHDQTVALLCGFLIGSLNKVWPWKVALETREVRPGKFIALIEVNVSPVGFVEATAQPAQLTAALLLMAAGFALVLALERLGSGRYRV
jgi:putative membrane protein